MKAWYFTGDQHCDFGPDGGGPGECGRSIVGDGYGAPIGDSGFTGSTGNVQGGGSSNSVGSRGEHITMPRPEDPT
jgi:hypothetical protein